jgi:dihydropteroate synthase
MTRYYRPIARQGRLRPESALTIAGGWSWFTDVACHDRETGQVSMMDAHSVPTDWLDRICAPRAPISGLDFSQPHLMGILNVTPDSFSDGGVHRSAALALNHAREMVEAGATIIDIGGESTRPGARTVPPEAEIARIEPVVRAVVHECGVPLSIDTRKAAVAEIAVGAGAAIVNDVSGFTYDPMLAHYCQRENLPVCIMHARGDPETMQDDPRYDDVLLDVYDFLAAQIAMLEEIGLSRRQIIVDPGIGFGKKIEHNLAILDGLSLYHGLGCPILLGASRKGFIGRIANAYPAATRAPGSCAVALSGVMQGVQIFRVHDVADTAQSLAIWKAIHWDAPGEYNVS